MAFNLPKYSITYADAQDRVNVIYLDPDGYGTASVTAITPAGSPLAYEFGSNNDDEYRALNPTGLLIRVKVGDTTLFDEISGDVALSWRVRWERSSTEVWRGYLITDEIEQPFNQPSILTLRAVCGIKELDGVKWTASAGVDSFVDHASDILSNLTGQVTGIGYASNWHSYNGGTAVTGNTFDRYEYNSAALSNPLDATELPVASLALEQTIGRFGAKMCLANGKWRIFQRSLLGASYSMSTYGGGSETISAFSIANADIYSDATGSNAPAYYQTSIGYYHYPEETGFILNGDFDNWTGSVPDNWTEVGGGGNLTKVPYNVSNVPRLIPINDGYVCQIIDVAHSGTDYGSDAVSNATIGIYQDSAFDVRATSHKISLSFSSRHIGNANANLLFFYSIWLDGDLGTDYFWDAPNKAWQSSGGGTIGTPTAGSKMGRIASDTWADFSIEATAVPDTGTIRVYLWNIVDKGGNTAGIWFRNVRVGYLTGDRSERVKTTTTSTNATSTSGLIRPESFYFMGQGPSVNHTGAITFGGGATLAENWKTSDYATSEASSGETLEKVHAEEILDARGNATPRIRLTFRPSSGSYWPHMPLSYNSNVYSCVMLSYDSRLDEYQGEWLKVGSSAVTIGTEEKYSDEDVRPTDFDTNIFSYTNRKTLGITEGGAFELAGVNGLFPRVNASGSDASGALGSNYFTGDLEISTGATISFKGGTLTRAVTGGDLTWNSAGLAFTYDRTDTVTVPSILNLTWDNENGTDTVNLGFTATDKGGGVWTTDDWHVSSAVPVLIETIGNNYDITLAPNGTGSVILDGLSYPQADGTAGQLLYTNGSGVLAFTTDVPTDGQVLIWNTGGTLTWETVAVGAADTDLNKCLMSNISDVSVGNTGVETTLISATVRGSKSISSSFVQTGTVLSVTARGYLVTKATGGGSDAIDMRFKVGGVTVLDTGAFSLGFDITAGWWEFMGDITVDTSGATGNVWAQGIFRWYDDNAGTYSDTHIVNSAVSSSINFTSSATMDFTADWTGGDAGNVITCTTLFVDSRHRA
jgi:hypothetical protein